MNDKKLTPEEELRDQAKTSIAKKRSAWQFLMITVLVNSGLSVIWFFTTPGEYFWPMWPMLGMGLGVVLSLADAYGISFNRPITESAIDAEVENLKRRG
jgi:2TM domain